MRTIIYVLLLLLLASCSAHNIKKEITNEESVRGASKIAVVLRISDRASISYDAYIKNIQIWLLGHGSGEKIVFLDENEHLSRYEKKEDRFYQKNADNSFLKYKSLGVMKSFIAQKKSAIQDAMREKGAEALLIFEVGGSFSRDMKIYKYNSVITLLNRENDIIYYDHQEKKVTEGDFSREEVETEYFDSLAQRLQYTLKEMKLLGE